MVWRCWVRGPHRISYYISASFSLGRGGRCHRLPPCISRRNCINLLGTWNVRCIHANAKREEVVNVFRKGEFELLALTETKLKGNGEVLWCEVNGIIAGVQEIERAR